MMNDLRGARGAWIVGAWLAVAGCGGPSSPEDPDASTGSDGGGGGGDCTGLANGASCGDGFICLAGSCVESQCGDAFVDEAAGEQCDDGNETAFDGCEPGTCGFTCAGDGACDDGELCNGVEVCGTATHACEPGEPLAPGSSCPRAGMPNGVCVGVDRDAQCVDLGCGNGVPDGDEDCDDGNDIAGDGCELNCTFSCTTNVECADVDVDVCDGLDVCDAETHKCESPATPLDCDDGVACTDDSCEAATGCVHEMNDQSAFWYIDCDEDAYSPATAGAVQHCMTPPTDPPTDCGAEGGWTATRPEGADTIDCRDTDPDVHPGATFHTAPIAGTPDDFDYDCDGMEEFPADPHGSTFCTCSTPDEFYYRAGVVNGNPMEPECGMTPAYIWKCISDGGGCHGYWARISASTPPASCR